MQTNCHSHRDEHENPAESCRDWQYRSVTVPRQRIVWPKRAARRKRRPLVKEDLHAAGSVARLAAVLKNPLHLNPHEWGRAECLCQVLQL